MKRFFILILIASFNVSAAEQAITQWVYNTLERAQANLDKGNLEAAERIYYDYANDTWSSRSYDHFVILRTYAYFLISYDRNEEALKGGKTGFVTVRLTVDEKGRVISAIIEESRPPRIFDAAAIQAVLKWKFKPRVIDGVAVKQVGLTTIEFNL